VENLIKSRINNRAWVNRICTRGKRHGRTTRHDVPAVRLRVHVGSVRRTISLLYNTDQPHMLCAQIYEYIYTYDIIYNIYTNKKRGKRSRNKRREKYIMINGRRALSTIHSRSRRLVVVSLPDSASRSRRPPFFMRRFRDGFRRIQRAAPGGGRGRHAHFAKTSFISTGGLSEI